MLALAQPSLAGSYSRCSISRMKVPRVTSLPSSNSIPSEVAAEDPLLGLRSESSSGPAVAFGAGGSSRPVRAVPDTVPPSSVTNTVSATLSVFEVELRTVLEAKEALGCRSAGVPPCQRVLPGPTRTSLDKGHQTKEGAPSIVTALWNHLSEPEERSLGSI